MQHLQLSTERHIGGTSSSSSSGVTLMEVSAFMAEQLKEQVKELRDHDEQVLQKVEAQRQNMDTLREEMQAKVDKAALNV